MLSIHQHLPCFPSVSTLFAEEPEYVAKYETKGIQGRLARLYGALDFLDTQIGRVLQSLEESGQLQNTVVMFMSDNGSLFAKSPKSPPYFSSEEWAMRVPSGMKGEKGTVDENGIRSYCFIRAPVTMPGIRSQLTSAMDVYPTVLDYAGVSVSDAGRPLDGFSLRPLVEGTSWSHDERFVHMHEVARDGIYIDQLPALDENREIIRPQPMFDFHTPSKWIDIAGHGSVRQGFWKLSRGKLYDMRTAEGRREEKEADGLEVKKRLADEYERWWTEEVAMNPGSYRKPVLSIGWPGRDLSILYPYCAIERTQKTVHIREHDVQGFQSEGDELYLSVDVKTPGDYQPVLLFKPGPGAAGAEFEIQLGTYPEIQSGRAISCRAAINKKNVLEFPALPLSPKNEKTELRLRLLANPTGGTVFEKLTEIQMKKM